MVKSQTGWANSTNFKQPHRLERANHTPCSAKMTVDTISKGHGALVSRAFHRTPEPAKLRLQVLPHNVRSVCDKSWRLTLVDSKAWERCKTASLWEQPPPPPHRWPWKTSYLWTPWLRFEPFELNAALGVCHLFHLWHERLANFFQLSCLTATFTIVWTYFRFKFTLVALHFLKQVVKTTASKQLSAPASECSSK